MIILGIDPGTQTTGFGVLEKTEGKSNSLQTKIIGNSNFKVIDFGCIITESTFSTAERLQKLHKELTKIIEKYKPDLISVESLFFFKNLKTVMPVSQARGVILLACAQKKVKTCEFTPLQVKMTIAGYGRAEKKQVQKMIKELLNLDGFDLKIKNRKKDDAADALGLAICGAINKPYL